MSVGVISQAKGSSYVEVGNCKVICGVYGPREVHRISDIKMSGQVMCEVKFAPLSVVKRKAPQPDRQQKEIRKQMKEALEAVVILEKYPKSQIDVFITVVEDGGSLLANCITAAGLALCHASIDVYDLVVGSSVLWHNGILYTDPTRDEEESDINCKISEVTQESGRMTIGVMPNYASCQLPLMNHAGELSVETLCSGVNSAVETSQRIYALGRKTLHNYIEAVLEEDCGD